ncbi:MAG: hypothetical protein NTZ05_17535 [Chloroflexi bacterium]|nr:hypothetical protein [Chloroflexota bacterium]
MPGNNLRDASDGLYVAAVRRPGYDELTAFDGPSALAAVGRHLYRAEPYFSACYWDADGDLWSVRPIRGDTSAPLPALQRLLTEQPGDGF